MESLYVYWETPIALPEQDADSSDKTGEVDFEVHQGFLTVDPQYSPDGDPVLVEELTSRVYTARELPSEATLHIETAPGELPPIVHLAQWAGFQLVRADTGETLR